MSPNDTSSGTYRSVICDRCGDETFGPWVPLDNLMTRFLCEACWEKRTT